MRGLPQVAAAPVLVLLVAGCGGGSSSPATRSTAGPKDQVRAYLAAFARGDGKAACALLTPAARSGVPSLSDDLESPDCEGAIGELSRASERLRTPHVSVTVDGDQATARITSKRPPYQSQVLLRKGDDGWRIAFPPAILQRFKSPPGITSG
jgi:hypothetical protein